MMSSANYAVTWSFRQGERTVRRALFHSTMAPCIEAARLIFNNPYSSDVDVNEVDTGRSIDWKAPGIGRVLVEADRD